ncbi:hypothetical protein SISNIDRAFT_483703 [Sistotremastrum niveocremeum HHB9708]|uniref:Uncharacterized protein n=1 Tax=Sistotremastrum niveocremeum HHB9708 TaxID=1314777 RepID=A0A164WY56_9AGAM|nr:hypothetical protein SISNIDRAFT_483703 [Sistotremastrum niveocremeum HHB9708]
MKSWMKNQEFDDEWVYPVKLANIVARELNIALATPRDIKRIHKKGICAEVVRKLLHCSQGPKSMSTYRGILMNIRYIIHDNILAHEIYKQNLDDFVFKCLEPSAGIAKDTTKLRATAICLIHDMTLHFPSDETCHSAAIKWTAKLTRLLPKYTGRGGWHDNALWSMLSTIKIWLRSLCTYRAKHGHALSPDDLHALQLRTLANTLVGLLRFDDNSSPPAWDNINTISACLAWIAYYESNAILSLPNNKGLSLFVAFTLSPSLVLRSRGFLGLLNLRHPDYSYHGHGGRFCDPRNLQPIAGTILPDEENFLGDVVELTDADAALEIGLQDEPFGKSDQDNAVAHEIPSSPALLYFNAHHPNVWEPALKFVDLELNGASANESYEALCRRWFGSPKIDEATQLVMVNALRLHGEIYKADVLDHSFIMRQLGEEKRVGRDPERIYKFYARSRVLAHNGVKRWPDNCYFHYAVMRGHSGWYCSDSLAKGVKCQDLTDHMEKLMYQEGRFNLFSMGVAILSLEDSLLKMWACGVDQLIRAGGAIAHAFEQLKRGTEECRLLMVLAFMTEQIMGTVNFEPEVRKQWFEEAKDALVSLQKSKSTASLEMRAAAMDFFNHRQKAQKQWAPMIEAVGKYKEVSDENQRANKFKGLTYEARDSTPERKPYKAIDQDQTASAIPEPTLRTDGTVNLPDHFPDELPSNELRSKVDIGS